MKLLSKNSGVKDIAVGVDDTQKKYAFLMKFFSYAEVTKESDYPIEKSFMKYYSNGV